MFTPGRLKSRTLLISRTTAEETINAKREFTLAFAKSSQSHDLLPLKQGVSEVYLTTRLSIFTKGTHSRSLKTEFDYFVYWDVNSHRMARVQNKTCNTTAPPKPNSLKNFLTQSKVHHAI